MFSNADAISDLESHVSNLIIQRAFMSDPDVIAQLNRSIAYGESRLSDLRNLGRNDSEPEVTLSDDEYVPDVPLTDPIITGPWGARNERITRLAHAKRLNVWRARAGLYRGRLMVGRMVVGYNSNGLPAFRCTHCGFAFSPVSAHRDAMENATILLIAHAHNDGPAFARRYTIAEQSCYPRGTTKAQRAAIAYANR